MKTQKPNPSGRPVTHHKGSSPLAMDLLPSLDKPRLRRALGSATVAGGLVLGSTVAHAQARPASFLLRGIDSPRTVPLPYVATAYGVYPPVLIDWDADGDLDLRHILPVGCSGNPSAFYQNIGTRSSPRFQRPRSIEEFSAEEVPFDNILLEPTSLDIVLADFYGDWDLEFHAVAAADLNGDGYVDLIDSDFGLHENVATANGRGMAQESSQPFDVSELRGGELKAIVFGDLDGDGDFDALVFEKVELTSHGYYFENVGDAQNPRFENRGEGLPAAFESGLFGGIPGTVAGAPVFADVDGDGDFDAMVGEVGFRNTGTAKNPAFVVDNSLTPALFPHPASAARVDLDGDGRLEMFTGLPNGTIAFSQQNQTALGVENATSNPFEGFQFSGTPSFSFVDIDGDQDLDLFVRDDSDRIFFFENVSPPSNGLDADADGLPDAWEVRHFGDIVSNHAGSDPDDDGLTNAQELDHGTNPLSADTDGDGFLDGTEVELGTLPLVPTVDPPIHVLPASPSASLKFVEVAPASLRLEALLPTHASVQLWHSPDLIRWTPVHGPFMGSGRMQEIVIEGSAENPCGFYRIEPAH